MAELCRDAFVCYLEFGKFSNNLHYVDYERLPIEEFSENGGSIPHNSDTRRATCVLHTDPDPLGPSLVHSPLQSGSSCQSPARPGPGGRGRSRHAVVGAL